jgi:hypothetical protein
MGTLTLFSFWKIFQIAKKHSPSTHRWNQKIFGPSYPFAKAGKLITEVKMRPVKKILLDSHFKNINHNST